MIVIVDYQMGNVASIQNMLRRIGQDSVISADKGTIDGASKLILPGVGAWDSGVRNIDSSGLRELLIKKTLQDKTPTLGICLGMQLLFKRSEEGELPGLGILDGELLRFRFNGENHKLKIPHMGWNVVEPHPMSVLFSSFEKGEELKFYFVHSYYVKCSDLEILSSTVNHGFSFPAAVELNNIYGTQFHPEKSHRFGLNLLKKFSELRQC